MFLKKILKTTQGIVINDVIKLGSIRIIGDTWGGG